MAQVNPAAVPAGGELERRERVDGYSVGLDVTHVTREVDRSRRARSHQELDGPRAPNSSASRPMSSTPRSRLRLRTDDDRSERTIP
jgi:hypothetical protein